MPVDQLKDVSTFFEVLKWRALRQPGRLAYLYLVDGEREESRLTYAELDQRARAIGAELQLLGLSGERVLLLYPSGLDFVAGFFGCLYAGAVAVPVCLPRPNRSLTRIQAIVADARVTASLTTASTYQRLKTLIAETSGLDSLKWLLTDRLGSQAASKWREPHITGNAQAFLQYTSGSTAEPKGVMVSHEDLLHNERMIREAFEHTEDSTVVGWLPLYHDMGLVGNVLQPLYVGAPCILMAPEAFLLKPFNWLRAISRYKAHTSGGPNFAFALCVRKITSEQRATLDLSSWRVAFSAAEPVRAQDLDDFAELFGPCGFRRKSFYPCYGLAEATLIVTGGVKAAPPVLYRVKAKALESHRVEDGCADRDGIRTLVGCGKTLPGQTVVIADPESLTLCLENEVGEIWLSGPSVTQGYWNRPEETTRTYQAYLADSGDGPFLRTGDLGFLKDGELFITGRLKELIIIRGQNHYPQDIERTVEQMHPVLQPGGCAAFSVDLDGEEKLMLIVEIGRRKVKCGAIDSLDELVRSIRRSVAEHHDIRVHEIFLLKPGSIPKTTSGKIQRNACRSWFLNNGMAAQKTIHEAGVTLYD